MPTLSGRVVQQTFPRKRRGTLPHILRIEFTRLRHVLRVEVARPVLRIVRIEIVAGRTSSRCRNNSSWYGAWNSATGTNCEASAPGGAGDCLIATTAAPGVSMPVPVSVSAAVHGFGQVECVGHLPNTNWRANGDRVGRGYSQNDHSETCAGSRCQQKRAHLFLLRLHVGR
jgi:hypothetical protein